MPHFSIVVEVQQDEHSENDAWAFVLILCFALWAIRMLRSNFMHNGHWGEYRACLIFSAKTDPPPRGMKIDLYPPTREPLPNVFFANLLRVKRRPFWLSWTMHA